MQENLDAQLCNAYPKMFVNRHASEMETCMCWGFACGDGWFNIINQLCSNIQHHIDWSVKNNQWDLERGEEKIRPVVEQVVVQQVKEKFGTLRFYYDGGDAYIHGLVAMAESLTAVTCETCGNPGERSGKGWIKTTCKPCDEKRIKARQLEDEAYEQKKLLKEGFEE